MHRAAGIYEYENTLKAVRKAIEMGMTRVETDVFIVFLTEKPDCKPNKGVADQRSDSDHPTWREGRLHHNCG